MSQCSKFQILEINLGVPELVHIRDVQNLLADRLSWLFGHVPFNVQEQQSDNNLAVHFSFEKCLFMRDKPTEV